MNMLKAMCILICLLINQINSYKQFNYCCLPCGQEHTLCKYKLLKSPSCNNVVIRKLTPVEKERILHIHNLHRHKIALFGFQAENETSEKEISGVSDMRQMEWDYELEVAAQAWANQCPTNSTDSCRDVGRFSVSQIVETQYIFEKEIDAIERIIEVWASSFKEWPPLLKGFNYTKEADSNLNFKKFCTITWDITNKIGCAITLSNSKVQNQTSMRNLQGKKLTLICNYAPAGSINKYYFRPGIACAHCPAGTYCSSLYSGLCTSTASGFDKKRYFWQVSVSTIIFLFIVY